MKTGKMIFVTGTAGKRDGDSPTSCRWLEGIALPALPRKLQIVYIGLIHSLEYQLPDS
jgi:hypothetical protein